MNIADLRSQFPGFSDDEIVGAVQRARFPDYTTAEVGKVLGYEPKGEFSKGFGRAFAEVPGMAAGVAAYGADVFGANDTRDSLLGYAAKRQQKVEQDYGSEAASFTSMTEGKASPGDFLANAAGYVVGQGLQAIATGGLTSLAFKALAKGAAMEAAKVATEKAIATGLAEEAARQVGMDAAKTVLSKSMLTGATAGAMGQNLGMELGSIYPDAVNEAQKQGRELTGEDKIRVGFSSLAAAAVDTAMERITGQKMLHGTPGSTLGGRLARQVPAGMARESITEGIQTGIEHYGAGTPIADATGMRDIVDSMAVGAVGGGLGGGVAGLHKIQEEKADAGLTKIATATTLDTAIEGAMDAMSVPLTGISAAQENTAMTAMEDLAKGDMQDLRSTGRAMDKAGTPGVTEQAARSREIEALQQAQRNAIGAGPALPGGPQLTADMVDMPFSDRLIVLQQQIADPSVRATIREKFGDEALSTVMHYAAAADRVTPDSMPEKTRDRLLGMAEGIVSRALLTPLGRTSLADNSTGIGRFDPLPAPKPIPQIGLDTTPTGTIRVDSQGNAAPETRADAINTGQPVNRPDGMTQQVASGGLPRDFTMVGDGTLTTSERKVATPTEPMKATEGLLLTADGFPYGTRAGAKARANKEGGGTVVEVAGGYAVQPEGSNAQLADVADPAVVAAGAAQGPSDQPGGSGGNLGSMPAASGAVVPTAEAPAPSGQPAATVGTADAPHGALSTGSTFELDGKTWTVTEATDKAIKATEPGGSGKMIAVGSKAWQKITGQAAPAPAAPAPAPAPNAFPTEKLAKLVEMSGRTREDVAKMYTALVAKYGHEQAGKMVDAAMVAAEARKSRGPAASEAWVNEGKTPADLAVEKANRLGTELASQIAEEASQQDFAPSDVPKAVAAWAKDHQVAADDLRQGVLKALDKLDISDGRKRQVLKALNPTATPDPAPEAKPAEPAPQVKTDKAEIRPYRRADGSIGYEAVPIYEKAQEPTEAKAKPEPAPAEPEKPTEKPAEAVAPQPDKKADLVELRKLESVLKSIKECLSS